MNNEVIIYQCCRCYDIKDPVTHKYYSAPKDVLNFLVQHHIPISHGYCGDCFRKQLIQDGCDPSELEIILNEVKERKEKEN